MATVTGLTAQKIYEELDKTIKNAWIDNDSGTLILTMFDGATASGGDFPILNGASLNNNSELILTFTNGDPINVGVMDSITSAEINVSGELVLTMRSGSNQNLGLVRTPTPVVLDYTVSGVFDKADYPGATHVKVEVWGGGGGGGDHQDVEDIAAGGGGGGGYNRVELPMTSLSATCLVGVGAGGNVIPGDGGGHGGNSFFESTHPTPISFVEVGGGAGGTFAIVDNNSSGRGGGGGGVAPGGIAVRGGGDYNESPQPQYSGGGTFHLYGSSGTSGGEAGIIAMIRPGRSSQGKIGGCGGGYTIHGNISQFGGGSDFGGGGGGKGPFPGGASEYGGAGGGGHSIIVGPAAKSKFGGDGGDADNPNGQFPGGGGCGGFRMSGSTYGTAGSGAPGLVRVTVYYS